MAAIDPVEENSEEQAAMFGALADPTRLKLVKLLCYQHGSHALCVNALAKSLGVTQSAVSQHLRLLRSDRKVVKGKRMVIIFTTRLIQKLSNIVMSFYRQF
jgi:DNA-binding transcriptional ArsR family regulator